MKRTFSNKNSGLPPSRGISVRRFRKAIESIMRKRSVDYEAALSILNAKGMKPTHKMRQAAGGGGKYQPL